MTFSHCPNSDCPNFDDPGTKSWYIRYGFHPTQTFGPVQRYRCRSCNKTFSDQTFSIDYSRVMQNLVTSSGLNDISRDLEVRIAKPFRTIVKEE